MADPDIFRVLSLIVFLGATTFVIFFFSEPWYRSSLGRSLMTMAIAVWLFSLTSVLRQWFGPDYTGRTEIRIVANMLLAYAVWSRAIIIYRIRKKKRLITHGGTP